MEVGLVGWKGGSGSGVEDVGAITLQAELKLINELSGGNSGVFAGVSWHDLVQVRAEGTQWPSGRSQCKSLLRFRFEPGSGVGYWTRVRALHVTPFTVLSSAFEGRTTYSRYDRYSA